MVNCQQFGYKGFPKMIDENSRMDTQQNQCEPPVIQYRSNECKTKPVVYTEAEIQKFL